MTDDRGLAIFDRLRYGAHQKPEALLYGFDLLEFDGKDLRRELLEKRKAALAKLIPTRAKNAQVGIRYVEHLDEDAAIIFGRLVRSG